jgi:hypothetical protein
MSISAVVPVWNSPAASAPGLSISPTRAVVAAELGVEREVDLVGPATIAGRRAEVADGVADGSTSAGDDVFGHAHGGYPQVRPLVPHDLDEIRGTSHVILAGGAMFVDLLAAAAQVGVGHHLDPIQAVYLRRQADLLGAGVAHAGVEAVVVTEAAERDGLAFVTHRQQPQRVDPGRAGGSFTLVEHAPGDIYRGALVGGSRQLHLFYDEIRRGGQAYGMAAELPELLLPKMNSNGPPVRTLR